MNMKHIIDQFLADKHLAIIGVSRDKCKWGHMLMRALSKRGYQIYPVNPNADMIEGVRCFHDIVQVPKFVTNALVVLPYESTLELSSTLKNSNIERLWLPTSGGNTEPSIKKIIPNFKSQNIDVVYDVCPMMFFVPEHIHKLHYKIKGWTKKLPKDLL